MVKKELVPILVVNSLAVVFFIFYFINRHNYEFLAYIGVILFFMFVIVNTYEKIKYPKIILWGLTIWSILHMAGGGIIINKKILYDFILIPLIGEPYNVLRYDQVVHFFGYAVTTLTMYYVLKPLLGKKITRWASLSLIVVMSGVGLGTINEIIEFITTIFVKDTNVGGYVNTSIDLISNLIGAVLAMTLILIKDKKK